MCSSPEFFSTRDVVSARKARRCEVCSLWISVGSEYLSVSGKWDGDFSSLAMHRECRSLYEMVRAADSEDCLGFSEVQEWISETRARFPFGINPQAIVSRRETPQHPEIRDAYAAILRKYRNAIGEPS